MRAPHQAADKRFYKRFNFESVPMEEYEVRDVSRRSEAPDLRLLYQMSEEPMEKPASDGTHPVMAQVQLMPAILNEAITPAKYIVIRVLIDQRLQILRWSDQLRQAGSIQLEFEGQKSPCTVFNMTRGGLGGLPVFQGVQFQLLNSPLSIALPGPGRYLLGWELYSPKMTPKSSVVLLTWDGTTDPRLIKQE